MTLNIAIETDLAHSNPVFSLDTLIYTVPPSSWVGCMQYPDGGNSHFSTSHLSLSLSRTHNHLPPLCHCGSFSLLYTKPPTSSLLLRKFLSYTHNHLQPLCHCGSFSLLHTKPPTSSLSLRKRPSKRWKAKKSGHWLSMFSNCISSEGS